jgi:hypothetical protein
MSQLNSTTTTTVTSPVFSLVNPKFENLANLNDTQSLLSLLAKNFDLNACLNNCSNHGICTLNQTIGKYVCECDSNFVGSLCQTDTRPCSSSPCLNNGTCVTHNDSSSFKCECETSFYGIFCENQVNLCLNSSCSTLGGFCFINSTTKRLQCKCKIGFSGLDCEIENTKSKSIRMSVLFLTILVCCSCFSITVILIVSNDILNYFGIKDKKNKDKKDKKNVVKKIKNAKNKRNKSIKRGCH